MVELLRVSKNSGHYIYILKMLVQTINYFFGPVCKEISLLLGKWEKFLRLKNIYTVNQNIFTRLKQEHFFLLWNIGLD